MPELHPNGNYEAYLAQLFNPLAGGTQFNPGVLGTIGGAGFGGLGTGTIPNMTTLLQSPWATQNPQQLSALWPQQQLQQQQQQQQQNPAQTLPAIQLAQHIATKQAAQAIQYAQALQALQQLVQNLATQQAIGQQTQFGQGIGGAYGFGQVGHGFAQPYGLGMQNPINQSLQQQALQQQMLQQQILQQQLLQQLAQYMASQQQPQFRYGLAA